jgi:hypothetical protein
VLRVLPKRFEKYGLTLHPEKTRLIEFGRYAAGKAKKQGGKPKPSHSSASRIFARAAVRASSRCT